MNSGTNVSGQPAAGTGLLHAAWKHRLWWIPALVVLLMLIGIVYLLGHLSSADSEMYPTSSRVVISEFQSS